MLKLTTDQLARKSIAVLVAHVRDHQNEPLPNLSYEEVAERIGRVTYKGTPFARGMGSQVFKYMGHLFEGQKLHGVSSIPHLQCLVGSKSDPLRLPEDGYEEFVPGYSKLSRPERIAHIEAEKSKIIAFGDAWNLVLRRFGQETVDGLSKVSPAFTGSGESPRHLALKEHVIKNPGIVGASKYAEVHPEYILPSQDRLDILFKQPKRWTAVEVKSRVSDSVEGDYKRGLYQIVKYRALIDAMRRDPEHNVPEEVTVLLVLESSLPKELQPLADKLDVEAILTRLPE